MTWRQWGKSAINHGTRGVTAQTEEITHLKTNQMSKFFDKGFETANTKMLR